MEACSPLKVLFGILFKVVWVSTFLSNEVTGVQLDSKAINASNMKTYNKAVLDIPDISHLVRYQ